MCFLKVCLADSCYCVARRVEYIHFTAAESQAVGLVEVEHNPTVGCLDVQIIVDCRYRAQRTNDKGSQNNRLEFHKGLKIVVI